MLRNANSSAPLLRLYSIVFLFVLSGMAQAAYITVDEAGMDAIYAQASFGNTPVDIRLGSAIEHVDPGLLTLDSATKWSALTSAHYGSATTVNFWFLDNITWCGNNFIFYVGCGETPGNDFVVESAYADSLFNAELLAHELGHNLGLPHNSGSKNLMDAFLNGGTDLSSTEVATIMSSPLVQFDNTGFFIEVLPVLVVAVATQVNAPAVSVLLLLGCFAVAYRRLRYGLKSGISGMSLAVR